MIVAAAFCPHPPALLPELAQGAAGDLAQVRAAAIEAVRAVAAGGRPVLVLGTGRCDERFPPGAIGSMDGFGADVRVMLGAVPDAAAYAAPDAALDANASLPLSLTVGAWLLTEALGGAGAAHGWSVAVGTTGVAGEALAGALLEDAEQIYPGRDCALLVMADGSARRAPAAPGYLDDRAAPFDAAVAAALASGMPAALAGLDPELGAELLAAGVPAWQVAGAVLARAAQSDRYTPSLLFDDAPYGVGYFVATWLREGGRTR